MPEETESTADFILAINNLFDLFNVNRPKMDSRSTRKGFGLAIKEQKEILQKAFEFVYNMRAPGNKKRLPCQKGVCQDINGLLKLKEYLLKKYGVHYILTERLNQDSLERMFGYLRAKGGGLHTHPTPLELFYRLRSCILGASFYYI